MTYYTKQKIKDIIKNYHHNQQVLKERNTHYSSVGVAQGGVESTLPKAQGQTSDVVANEAIRQIEANRVFANIQTDIKYLQDRLDRVKESDEELLTLFLSGCNIHDVANYYGCSTRTVDRKLDDIACCIMSVT